MIILWVCKNKAFLHLCRKAYSMRLFICIMCSFYLLSFIFFEKEIFEIIEIGG